MFCPPSSSSTTPQEKHDVFLSFRGEDTRENFIGHLYGALCRKKIETFIDNQLIRGDEISPSLMKAIQESKISVVVFSKGYASSRWCLKELVEIIECKKKHGQIVIPVFYHVNPSDVRHQTGTFADAFAEHEEYFNGRGVDMMKRWRIALTEAANLSGLDSAVIRSEYTLVEEIVKLVLKRLNDMSSSENKDLVGVDSRITEIELLLGTGSVDVCTVGIWGIGGIGKTAIADVIFNKIFSQFEVSYFMRNVRERFEENGGLIRMQQDLFSVILEDTSLNIGTPCIGLAFTKRRLERKKALIVFDDVADSSQIESLIGRHDLFGSGSQIIITTRNKQVLSNCGVDKVYEVKQLSREEALRLFSRYAFKQDCPTADYMELSDKVEAYAKGVPLALKVLGSSLFGKQKQVWESTLDKLKKSPHMDIQKVLKISYDGLDEEEKTIFLDIASFFKEGDRDHVVQFLDACGFSTEYGLSVLIDKSLITILGNVITMHDLLQEMGRGVVLQESKDPGKRSRLWHHEHIYHVLTKNTGTEATEGISLDMSKIKEMCVFHDPFVKMNKLRFLKFYDSSHLAMHRSNKVNVFQDLEFSTELRHLQWLGWPLKSLPSNFSPENLVQLDMPRSKLEHLWNGVQDLVNLKHIDLSDSVHLIKCPDLSLATNLESLVLDHCISLREIPSSIQYLNKLITLGLTRCKSLRILGEIPCSINFLRVGETSIEELPSSIGNLSRLVSLDLKQCSRLKSLPSSISMLKSLNSLILLGCSMLNRLPENFGNVEVSPSTVHSNKRDRLSLPPSCLGMFSLKHLDLANCGIMELPESLGWLSSLEKLYARGNNFETIPTSIIDLSNLIHLELTYCERLQSIPELPENVAVVQAQCCTSLKALPGLFRTRCLKEQKFNFENCFQLGPNAFRDISEDALLKIQLMKTAWWENTKPRRDDAFISLPGSEIPEWFSYQSPGSFITLKLPPNWDNRNFLGFALCTVVAFPDYDVGEFQLECGYRIKHKDGQQYVDDAFLWNWANGYDAVPHDQHVFLGFKFFQLSHGFVHNTYSDEVSIEFHLKDGCLKPINGCEVKRCGVHLIYAQDFGEPIEEGTRNLNLVVEEEQYPRPKRLKFFPFF